MKKNLSRYAILPLVVLSLHCARNPCPQAIGGSIVAHRSGIGFGKGKSFLEGTLTGVRGECLLQDEGRPQHGSSAKGVAPRYEVAATADVAYEITDRERFDKARSSSVLGVQATVVFEAVTAQGVVLGTGQGYVTFIPGVRTTSVSTKITGLSSGEISRVAKVQVRWKY